MDQVQTGASGMGYLRATQIDAVFEAVYIAGSQSREPNAISQLSQSALFTAISGDGRRHHVVVLFTAHLLELQIWLPMAGHARPEYSWFRAEGVAQGYLSGSCSI